MLLTMPTMSVNASTTDTGLRRDSGRADDMLSMARTYEEFAISLVVSSLALHFEILIM